MRPESSASCPIGLEKEAFFPLLHTPPERLKLRNCVCKFAISTPIAIQISARKAITHGNIPGINLARTAIKANINAPQGLNARIGAVSCRATASTQHASASHTKRAPTISVHARAAPPILIAGTINVPTICAHHTAQDSSRSHSH